MTQIEARANVVKYYVAHIFSGASFIVPITILYYASFGLSFFLIASLESIFLFIALIMEVPTGAFADTIGRKYATAFGTFLVACGTLVLGLGSTFFIFALAQIMFGIGAALRSGADTALIYDSLQEVGATNTYAKIEGMSYALFSIFGAIAAPLGAYFFVANHRLPFLVDSMLLLLAALSYGLMIEPQIIKSTSKMSNYFSTLKNGVMEAIKKPIVRWYMSITILLSVVAGFFASVLSQPTMIVSGINIIMIGYIFSAILLVQAISAIYADRLAIKLQETISLILMFAVPGVAFLVMGTRNTVLLLFALLAYNWSKGFQYPILKHYIQRHLDSTTRATALSTQNLFDSLAGIILIPILGLAVDKTSPSIGVMILGIITLSIGFLLLLIRPINIERDIPRFQN